MSRKRGKQRKAPVEAVPEDALAEGSGPVRQVEQDVIRTVDDVVTTDDIATTEDVVTADDVVATAEPTPAGREPEPEAGKPRRAERPRKTRRAAGAEAADAASADAASADALAPADGRDARTPDPSGGPGGARDAEHPDAARVGGAPHGEGPDAAERDGSVDAGSPGEAPRAAAADAAARATEDVAGATIDDMVEDVADGDHGDGDHGDALDGEDDGDAPDDATDDAVDVFPTSAATMDAVQLKHLVEALVFAADRPLTVQRLRQLTRVSDVRRLEQALSEIAEDYRERGLVLQQVSGGYQFRTRTQFSPWVQQLIAGRPVRLSRAQLETLAIIAYRQPITRPEIDDIRGVDSTATLKLLIDRALIRVLGKREEVGRPMLYGTTKEFLDFFSLGDLRELPTLREYSELTAESRKVMSERLGIAADGSDGPAGDGSDPDDGSGNGHGGNGHGGYGGADGGADGLGGGLSDDGSSASAAADDRAAAASPDDSIAGEPPAEPELAIAADTAAAEVVAAETAAAETASEDGAAAPESTHGDTAYAMATDGIVAAPLDDVSEAVSTFWAASDAVDRSDAAALGDGNGDGAAPADTWFDPSIDDSTDEGADLDGLDEPGNAARSPNPSRATD